MRIRLLAIVLGMGGLVLGTGLAQRTRIDAAQYGWQTDYQAARALAKKTGKPLFVTFRCEA
jgi:predicted NBD/HSP70 family sugar kinase